MDEIDRIRARLLGALSTRRPWLLRGNPVNPVHYLAGCSDREALSGTTDIRAIKD
jgi:hypothetical protein